MTTPAIEMVDGLPIFSAIEPASIKPAIEKAIAACKSEIDEVVASKDYSYQNLVLRLEEADDRLSKIFSPVCSSSPNSDGAAFLSASNF